MYRCKKTQWMPYCQSGQCEAVNRLVWWAPCLRQRVMLPEQAIFWLHVRRPCHGSLFAWFKRRKRRMMSVVTPSPQVTVLSGRYRVEDLDDRSQFSVANKDTIPLPLYQPVPNVKGTFYPEGWEVLALYPGTTCMYPAQVVKPPTRMKNYYILHFDDDDYEDGRVKYQSVPTRFVVNNVDLTQGRYPYHMP